MVIEVKSMGIVRATVYHYWLSKDYVAQIGDVFSNVGELYFIN